MGTSLSGLTPSATYTGLLKFGDNSAISASLKLLSDGAGNDTLISLSTTAFQIGNNTSMGARFGVKGSGATSATTSLLVQDSAGSEALRIYDDRLVVIGSIIQSDSFSIGQSNPNLKGIVQSGSKIQINYVNGGGVQFSNSSSGFKTLIVGGVSEDIVSFGGITSSFPALKRSSTTLQSRLADDSAFAPLQGKLTTDTAYVASTQISTGYITIYDSTGTAYKVLVAV